MKTLFFTLLLSGISTAFALAQQNSATVKQNGNGNSVSINQSSEKKSAADCPDANLEGKGNNNLISVTTSGDASKTILHRSGSQHNNLSALLFDLHTLEAFQKGDANSLLLSIPQDEETPQSLSASQEGERNSISARMSASSAKVSVSQNGSGNSVSINPCEPSQSQ